MAALILNNQTILPSMLHKRNIIIVCDMSWSSD